MLALAAWGGTLPLLALVASRVLALDDSGRVATVQSGLPHVLLPAWAALGFAWTARRPALGAVAGVVVIAHVAWLTPEVRVEAPVDDAAHQAPPLRLFSANLMIHNARIDELIDEIRDVDPDVVALQEYDRGNARAIEASGLLDRYPHRVEAPSASPFGALLASKVPFTSSTLLPFGGRPMPSAVLATAIGPVEVICVHMTRADVSHDEWAAQHRDLATFVQRRTTPVIIAGDFNASTAHRPFRALLATDVTDAHRALGRGLSRSWPNGGGLLPPLIRIDHVLTTPEIVVTSVRNGRGAGSDHIPLIAELALVGPR